MDVAKIAATIQARVGSGLMPEARVSGASETLPPKMLEAEKSAEAPEVVAGAVERIREQMQNLQRNLNFSVDDSTGQVVVQVVDGDSGTVVRQIPSEDILRLAERLEEMRSLLFEAKA